MYLLFAMALAGRIDRIVAVVDDTVVLQSDVDQARLLAQHDRRVVPFWTDGDPAERQIEAAMITEAAGDVSLYQPDDDDVRARLEGLRARFAERRDWEAFLLEGGWSAPTLADTLRARMRVEAYLTRSIAPRPDQTALFALATRELVASIRPRLRVRRVDP